MEDNVIWKAKKRNLLLLGLPLLTFTTYSLDEDALYVRTGLLNLKFEEVKLYKVRDYTIKMNLFQRILGLGTLHIYSADSTAPDLDIANIRDVLNVKKLIEMSVEAAKKKVGVRAQEFYITDRPKGH